MNGAKNTLILSFAGAALGFGLGLFIALFSMSQRAVVRAPARVYINFFRGTPLIWQLSFAGLGVVTALRLGFFSGTDGPYRVAIVVLGLNLAAYSAEVYRAGIQSLERGQMEAARSVGLTYFQAMRYVIVPQAVRRVIPPLTNEFVILIKDTSLVVELYISRPTPSSSFWAKASPSTTTSDVSLIRMTNSLVSGGITRRMAWGTIT